MCIRDRYSFPTITNSTPYTQYGTYLNGITDGVFWEASVLIFFIVALFGQPKTDIVQRTMIASFAMSLYSTMLSIATFVPIFFPVIFMILSFVCFMMLIYKDTSKAF